MQQCTERRHRTKSRAAPRANPGLRYRSRLAGQGSQPLAAIRPQPHREAAGWSSRQCRRFHEDFAGAVRCAIATAGQSGSGINPPTVSCPLASTNTIGSLVFASTAVASFRPPKALPPIVVASKDSTRTYDFIFASCDSRSPVFPTTNQDMRTRSSPTLAAACQPHLGSDRVEVLGSALAYGGGMGGRPHILFRGIADMAGCQLARLSRD